MPNDNVVLKIEVDSTEAETKLATLQQQADTLLATLEKCKGACADCQIKAEFSLKGSDLVAISQAQNYREARTA